MDIVQPYFLLLFVLSILVNGQNTQEVEVGQDGSFYTPFAIYASVNDTIRFIFSANFHSVVQGSFDRPCIPLAGGFNSGLAGRGSDLNGPIQVWDLHITDDTKPIWFFCQGTRPSSHCNEGMVGAINPPSISMFNDYKKGAQLAIDIPEPTPAVTVSGIGAFATASPSNLSIQPTLTSSVLASSSSVPAVVASSSTSSLLNMPTTSPTPHRTINQGAIIGAAVAGGMVVAILLGLIGCCIYKRRLRKSNRESDFFRYRVGPYSRPAEVSASTTPMESSTQVLTEGNKITWAPSIALYSAVPRSNSPPIGPSNATNTRSAVGHQNIRRNKSYELQSHSISRSQPHVPDIRIAYTETDSSKGDSRLQRQISLDQSTIRAQRVDRHNIPQSQLRPNRPAESAANPVPEHDAGRLDVEFIAREVAARLLNTFPSHLDYSAPAIDQSPPIMDPVLSPLRRQSHTASYSVDSLVGISNVPAPPPQYHPN